MSNIYYSPEKFGLKILGEVEFSSGAYQFDTTLLFHDEEHGEFYVASDSGCSCPCPFEDIGRGDLTPVRFINDLIKYLDGRKRGSYYYDYETDGINAACQRMSQKFMETKYANTK